MKKQGGLGMANNIMFGYSLAAGFANYYRLLLGSIKDVKSFKICVQEYGCTNITLIVDKEFQSNENIKFIDSMDGIMVIMALRRNTKGLDYTPEVEQSIDVFKNTLEADTSYMQTEQSLETWMFYQHGSNALVL